MPPTGLPEADVLAALYECGEATARDIREALAARRPLAHASVATLLGRLEERGYVRRRKGTTGKAFLYMPTNARPRAFAPMLKRLLQRGFGGSSVALVASLFETRPPTAAELEEIQALVRSYGAAARPPKGGGRP